jgi:surface antigen
LYGLPRQTVTALAVLAILALQGYPGARAETLPWLDGTDAGYQQRYDERYEAPPSDGRYGAVQRDYYEGDGQYRQAANAVPADIARGSCNRSSLPGNISKQTVGGAIGGLVGGLLGSQVGSGSGKTAATIAGVLLGAAAGSYLGKSMDAGDQYCTRQALEYAPNDRPISWMNPDTNNSYTVTPVNTYETRDGRYCREYTTTATLEGSRERVAGTACRRPDGTWEIVN